MARLRNSATALISVVAVIVVGAAAFWAGSTVVDRIGDVGPEPAPIATAHLSGSGPGSLLSAMSMPHIKSDIVSAGALAARVVYRSTDGSSGTPTVVSGTVFVPDTVAPRGGWPVVAYGHGAIGINEPCAPSLSDDLWKQWTPVVELIKRGFAVAFPDYQGLGAPGIHPFSDARTAGLNLIDAVRALRATFPDISSRWAGWGGSQGGGAVWAANEQAQSYAPELSLVGTVALSPAADITGVVDRAERGTLTSNQAPILQWILTSLGRIHPDLNLDDYRSGTAAENWSLMTECTGVLTLVRSLVAEQIGPYDLAPKSPEAAQRLRSLLADWALPQRKLNAPMSVVYGSADTFIDADWTTSALAKACGLGGNIVWRLEEGKGHLDVSSDDQLGWLLDRFAGHEANGMCSRP